MKHARALLIALTLTPGTAFAHEVLMSNGTRWDHPHDQVQKIGSMRDVSPTLNASGDCASATWPYIPADCLVREIKPEPSLVTADNASLR